MKISIIKKSLIIVGWLVVWSLVAALINNDIVLVGPVMVLKSLVKIIFTKDFLLIAGNSMLRITLGFLLALIIGVILGSIAYKHKIVEEILQPFVTVIKVVPVASFVVLLLLWVGSSNLSFLISMLIVFPQVYVSTLSGAKATDDAILEMAEEYKYSAYEKIVYIYKDSVLPYIISNSKVSFGMAWKSGVAAEVIGMTGVSLGERIYMAKIYLDTASLFSWTLIVVMLSYLLEKVCLLLLNKLNDWHPIYKGRRGYKAASMNVEDVSISDINVSFDGRDIIRDAKVDLKCGEIYYIKEPSGAGKTTLLNEIRKRTHLRCGVVFQEDRLLEDYDAITNIMLGHSANDYVKNISIVERVLDKEVLRQKVSELSGGMKRRVALIRALTYDCQLLILDEPFSGLDEDRIDSCIDLISELGNEKTILFVSHRDEEHLKLGAKRIALEEFLCYNPNLSTCK